MDERIPGLLERPEMCASFVTPHLIYSIYKCIDNIKLYNQGDCSHFFFSYRDWFLLKGGGKGETEEYTCLSVDVYKLYNTSKDKATLIINKQNLLI